MHQDLLLSHIYCRHGGEFPDNPQRKRSAIVRNKGRKDVYINRSNKGRKLTGFEYADESEFEIPYRKKGQCNLEDTMNPSRGIHNWLVYTSNREKFQEWCDTFEALNPTRGRISGTLGKLALQKSGLSNSTLKLVWKLADVNEDGMLDCHEFCLAMYLIELSLSGNIVLPTELPTHLYPPNMATNNTF